MSVSALARAIGVPQSNLSEMLAGKRDWSKTAIRGLSRRSTSAQSAAWHDWTPPRSRR